MDAKHGKVQVIMEDHQQDYTVVREPQLYNRKYFKMNKCITLNRKGILLGLCAVVLFGFAANSDAWIAPTRQAPDGNTMPPVNSSPLMQDKEGSMSLGSLSVFGDSVFTSGIKITEGNPGIGKVLMSDEEGIVRWETYENAKKIAKKYKCPEGSSLLTLEDRTFCAYSKWTSGYGYCDKFGQSFDPMIECWDVGHGRNHGVSPYWNGCYAWEGPKNYGGQGAKFFCEKQVYVEKKPSDCTDEKAVLGTINEPLFSSEPITTCSILTPYTYKGCLQGVLHEGLCMPMRIPIKWLWFSGLAGSVTSPVDINATSTTCPVGWTRYLDICI
jgi:hypothetical protein